MATLDGFNVPIYEIGPARPHQSLGHWREIWSKCRDVLAGEESIKLARERYLPMMSRMTADLYEGYLHRAMFYGASQRTLQGLLGSLLRKPPVVYYNPPTLQQGPLEADDAIAARRQAQDDASNKILSQLNDLLTNITQTGVDLHGFARDIASEILSVGRVGILVDAPPITSSLLDPTPYARLYNTESIINWREHFEGGVPVLDQVVLLEQISSPGPDGFGVELTTQFRELTLNEDGTYVQNTWVINPPEDDKGEAFAQLIETTTPLYRGRPLRRLPFFFCTSSHTRPEIERPPLLDLFNVNLSHYRSSADLEHGRHYTALPTPVVTGVDQTDDAGNGPTLEIGSSTAWLLPMNASARMLEFNGQGLKHLENAMTQKEALMTNLGARMLEPDKKASETAEALRLRQAGDIANLNVIADTISSALTWVIRLISWWSGTTQVFADDALFIQLDKDYFESRLSPSMIASLVSAWQAGAFSFRDLYFNLVRGETIDPDRPYEEVLAEVKAEVALRQASIAVKPTTVPVAGTTDEGAN